MVKIASIYLSRFLCTIVPAEYHRTISQYTSVLETYLYRACVCFFHWKLSLVTWFSSFKVLPILLWENFPCLFVVTDVCILALVEEISLRLCLTNHPPSKAISFPTNTKVSDTILDLTAPKTITFISPFSEHQVFTFVSYSGFSVLTLQKA